MRLQKYFLMAFKINNPNSNSAGKFYYSQAAQKLLNIANF